MDNKEMSNIEKELLDSAAKLDSSKVEPDELEQTAGGFCCGGDCKIATSWCAFCTKDSCMNTCAQRSPS